MKKILILAAVSFLAGCVGSSTLPQKNAEKLPHIEVPKEIVHNGKTYYLRAQQDLGSVARYVYLENKENLKNWKSEIEILNDRNTEQRSIADRIALREKVYKNTGVEHFQLMEKDDSLYAFVIYAPSAQHDDWQVDVAKGENVMGCGFAQYQYSLKIPKTKKLMNMGKVKLIGYLKKYAVDKEMERLSTTKWNWVCRNNE
ncbi:MULTISPECIES: hypothetical protein [Basfia]|uniref:Uncharacterized protein n=2 Tax=Basfia TaxID=697331 RepID=Q65VM8_MANSM|nr:MULTISPECIES: hypothetical protein [Basfia]AAU36982.1 unknown [[Mannheimia] succiniciproducens MBEL55E]QIM69757.1 6-phosphofructokinase [Basfia succiniciproducens]SCX80362.1 hypothetical protein SAMN02910354_00406 [Basfia succiniciproducens]SEQ02363.1 hypothetical protein SAMN02910415_00796 [Basfia succiniciproducens]